jgi:integrase
MTIIPKHKTKPPREPRISKGGWHFDEVKVFGGRVKIFRTKQSGDVWQMRVWFHENQKYFRKSLRTEDIDEAKLRAEEIYLDLRAKVKNGERVFEHTTRELVNKYIEHRNEDVIANMITKERLQTISSQMKHYLSFVGDNIKIDAIPPHKFQEYHSYRKTYAPTVRLITLANEISTIKNFYQFGIDRRFISSSSMPLFPKIKKRNHNEKLSRDELSIDEWRTIYKHMEKWHLHCDKDEAEEKEFVRDFALLLANTGLRFGEARKLRWSDIHILTTGKSVDVKITVREGKTGYRVVIGRRGDILARLKRLSKHTKPNDYVFVDNKNGSQINKDVYYKHWNKMLKDTKLDQSNKQIVFYALRHTYATWRLYSGVDVFTLSKNMGCSVAFIEQHYGHIEVEKQRSMLVKDISKEHISILLE